MGEVGGGEVGGCQCRPPCGRRKEAASLRRQSIARLKCVPPTLLPPRRERRVPHVQSLAPGTDGINSVDYAAEHNLDFWSELP
jgi:hypothetical protein